MVSCGMQVMLMCDMAAAVLSDARAKGLVTDSSLGAALASGEVPYAQASALHILSTSILPALSDQNRRALLSKLAALLAKPGCATPTAVVAIEGLSLLMAVLGELGDDDAGELVERTLIAQTSSHSGPVRYQAARGLAAMVSAQPARAARVISRQLDCLQAAANLLCGQHVSTGPLGMDTSALGELIGKAQPGLIAAAHGAALAAAAGLWVAPQLPLSIPRALPCRAAALARHLITEPHATGNTPRALLKESGYILLNVLLDYLHPGGDADLAMQLWWRAVALQALNTYLARVMAPGLASNAAAQGVSVLAMQAICLGKVLAQMSPPVQVQLLDAHVPVSVGALMAVARRPAGCTAVWALHALSLCAQASGPAFTSHIHGSLRLARDLLLTSQLADEQLRPAAARLANAVVGVMGPELSLGSATYLLAKCLTRDLCTSGALVVHDPALLAAVISAQAGGQLEEVEAGKAGQEVAVRAPWPIAASTLECELQAVLFTQQLVLCCGQAVQISKHLAVLQATLLSEHHALHKAAVGTLRLLAGKDAQAVLSGRIEVAVITALDSETDAVLAAAVAASAAGLQGLAAAGALRIHTRMVAAQLLRLVEVGYKLATGPLEALRPAGVQLLDQLVQGFSQVEDPLMPGARLLEQYQAQLVSALRTALAPGSAPTLLTAGWRLSTCFLASGLTAGDGVVLRRLLELLVSPLASWHALGSEQQYGEWVGLQQRVALLEAHAQCTLLQWRGSDAQAAAIIGQAQRPHSCVNA
ncbi:HEAT repeat-containing 5B isoform X2 [Haematococcus lacustris]|uniref:HEAT repeat-containing 5B isoform X2 n=1 Tax=Haematococcus lacustris TaxID=44745 RepID=A0A6A0A2G9_HAELA|nr:HEAT repeat-containing 5B isoform X2 [Haematococcus lacustris]